MTGGVVPGLVEAPVELRRSVERAGTVGRDWCDALPALATELITRWDLRRTTEPPRAGFGGVAIAVTRADGEPAVLKISFTRGTRDDENESLAAWAGRRAARLLERDDAQHARLLERLGDESVFDLADPVEAMSILGALAADLAVPAPPGLPRMADVAPALADQLRSTPHDQMVQRAVQAAAATYDVLGADQPETLLHGDLQGRNVLRSHRAGWAAIDPQGMVAEPALDALTGLRDRWTSLPTRSAPRAELLRQLEAYAEAADTPRERVIAWTHARCVRAVVGGVDDDGGLHDWVAGQLDDLV